MKYTYLVFIKRPYPGNFWNSKMGVICDILDFLLVIVMVIVMSKEVDIMKP